MIIDTHVHYTHKKFHQQFNYVDLDANGAVITAHGTLGDVFEALHRNGVRYSIEPAIGYDSNRTILDFCAKEPTVFPALGWHPKRLDNANRKTLADIRKLITENADRIVAVGEIGLDHHTALGFQPDRKYKRKEKRVFRYFLNTAHKAGLPLILHIREADEDGLRILERFARRHKLHGGVAHCFNSDVEIAKRYTALGFCIGIGCALFFNEALNDVVKEIPLECILLETDAPYVLPKFDAPELSGKAKAKVRNTPAVLPLVVSRIAELRGITAAEVEEQTAQNAVRVFGLKPINNR